MSVKLLSGLLLTTASCVGLLANAPKAEAFSWDNSWTQPTIQGKQQTQFNDQPFQSLVQQERIELKGSNQQKVDPNRLSLKYAYNPWAFFINEGAGFKNQLAYQATGGTNQSGLLFNNISSQQSILKEKDGVLNLGDGVNMGQMAAGTQLDFGLRANGWNIQQNAAVPQKKADDLKPQVEQVQKQAAALRKTSDAQQQTAVNLQKEAIALKADLTAKQAALKKATAANKSAAQTAVNQAQAASDSAALKSTQAATAAKEAAAAATKAEKEAQTLASQMQKFQQEAASILSKANVYSTQTQNNLDGLQHVVSYVSGNYLLLGFEDLYGKLGATGTDAETGRKNESSDRDFNDSVFAIKIGKSNARQLVKDNTPKPVPESSAMLPLLGLGLAGVISRRRRNNAKVG